jgi:hypothetical protein
LAFFVIWFVLGFVERPISRAIATNILETRRIEREAAEAARQQAADERAAAANEARLQREAEEAARKAARDASL